MARRLVREGAQVVLNGRSLPRLEAILGELVKQGANPQALLAIDADLTESEGRNKLIHTIGRRFGALDLVVNAAQVGAKTPVDHNDPTLLRSLFEINLFSLVELTTALMPLLKAGRNPVVINLGTKNTGPKRPGSPEYQSVLAAITAFTESSGNKWSKQGIHFLRIDPTSSTSADQQAIQTIQALRQNRPKSPLQHKKHLSRPIQKALSRLKNWTLSQINPPSKPIEQLPRPHIGIRMQSSKKMGD
jgi:NAD(P)-dependent dehydrogenase (short-subunit alcohol dehydrogenase family)